ncbi:unnamed protein product [Arabis nemorensis]|uniref:RRM domain-containing protein n=1 Tax=Arabis nemorensis TaxID=586526 RepID=A0A565C3S6_9BRAS|nr:unnamed protein product [Arabis nemorensis]
MLLREGAKKKALALSGSDMGGWNVLVKALPKLVCKFSTDLVAALREADYRFMRSTELFASGYDTLLPEDDIKSALIKHFSSCGEITNLHIRTVDYRNNVRV